MTGNQACAMKLHHKPLVELLQRAYSAEKAAAFAYVGHAASLRDPLAKAAVKQIEEDEWGHRRNVFAIMQQYDIPVSRFYEFKFHIIGRVISASCHVIGWFMPYFFAGKLESGNVCEYFVMMKYFHSLDINKHDEILYEMASRRRNTKFIFCSRSRTASGCHFLRKYLPGAGKPAPTTWIWKTNCL